MIQENFLEVREDDLIKQRRLANTRLSRLTTLVFANDVSLFLILCHQAFYFDGHKPLFVETASIFSTVFEPIGKYFG